MTTIKVSVIIPTYKPKDYLWECLRSLNKQTIDKSLFEVILILNGCCEPWKSEIEKFIDYHLQDLNVCLLLSDVPGVSNARNMGIDTAVGEYITFIDDDDFVSHSYLEELLDKATRDVVSLCYPLSFVESSSEFLPYYITKDFEHNQNNQYCHYTNARRYFNGPVYKLIHRDIIGNRRFDPRLKNGEDSVFMFLISDRLNKVSFTSTNATYYRRVREGSSTTKRKSLKELLYNYFVVFSCYNRIFFSNPLKYNFYFFVTRILGIFLSVLEQLKK